ncbi:MAG: fructose-bisphosphatase class II, partial [Bacteroidetes bacterium]
AATAITEGSFLEGVRFDRGKDVVTTESIVIRSASGSLRYIRGIHQFRRKFDFEKVDADAAARLRQDHP